MKSKSTDTIQSIKVVQAFNLGGIDALEDVLNELTKEDDWQIVEEKE